MQWSNSAIVIFLDIFCNFVSLWNMINKNYSNRNAKEASLKKLSLLHELSINDAGLMLVDVKL